MASSGSNGSSSDAAKVTAPPTSPPVATRALGVMGDTCAVGNTGQCLSTWDRVEGDSYYLAAGTAYCESSDNNCSTCRARWLEEYAASGETESPVVCSGENGCICLAVCERESWNSLVIQDECPVYERAKIGSIILVLAMGFASYIVFSMLTVCFKRLLKCTMPWFEAYQVDPFVVGSRRPPRSPRGPLLALSGWKSMREKLIETEHDNGTPGTGPAGVMRIQLSATEGTSVIVEEGDGFRPTSPSQQYRTGRPEEVAPALAMLR
ncbi:hypothetical protein PF005_g25648 [Phytophthora fragariae]|uniref:Uncharacterized protein n=2 Tax=Phytophthora fragariae TaxID=53985 RepID=A0A6A3SSW9_9STRA|nr:hypothetical protein PF003_g1946 [Phytophthora fragariae]KAE9074389.1 hypothetical protein PF010_g24691 [Phytophthora fragariae]KAE9091543.1 hypothetical protein PF006_g24903 [Phytophthora fragariae]KAE9122798.1 hypothetical protein PF007_g7301 [Phytophthora fragariae]KAE9174896.1 hypothetical protein PF005_g25648 [Phytophthora fragariae]